jgi:hypothetical protein
VNADAIGILVRGLLDAIRAHELERAANLIVEAELRQQNKSYDGRSEIVNEISRAIAAAKRAKKAALAEVDAIPDVSRLDIEQRLRGPLERLLEREIDNLRAERRRASRQA